MILQIFVPILGLALILASGRRIFSGHRSRVVIAAIFVTGALSISREPLIPWLLIGASALILSCIERFFRPDADKILRNHLQTLLDRLILSMKAGRPLKISLREAARELSPAAAAKVSEIADRFELAGKEDGLTATAVEILRGLRSASMGSAKTVERLESWRHSVRLREEFRRRSGQVTLQIRVQAGLSLALFLPVFFWNLVSGGSAALIRCAIASLLFLLAQIWIHVSFRRFKWTI